MFLKMLSLFEHAPINALLSNYRHSGLQLEEKGNDYHAGFVCFSVIFTALRSRRNHVEEIRGRKTKRGTFEINEILEYWRNEMKFSNDTDFIID